MSNEEVSIKELTIDELIKLLDAADIVQLDSEENEPLTYYHIDDGEMAINFESKNGEDILFNVDDGDKITRNGNKITIDRISLETCEFLMFKKVPLID
jgi:hypothetical protein